MFWNLFWDARCSGETIYTAVAAHHTIETWFSWHFMAFHGISWRLESLEDESRALR